ncbi:TPA: hypothetical protein HA278_08030 [Candidatus Woesearchaeota archaeon]|nr:hypothetical protein [Candidatus Woesearchaeota archaeon]
MLEEFVGGAVSVEYVARRPSRKHCSGTLLFSYDGDFSRIAVRAVDNGIYIIPYNSILKMMLNAPTLLPDQHAQSLTDVLP